MLSPGCISAGTWDWQKEARWDWPLPHSSSSFFISLLHSAILNWPARYRAPVADLIMPTVLLEKTGVLLPAWHRISNLFLRRLLLHLQSARISTFLCRRYRYWPLLFLVTLYLLH